MNKLKIIFLDIDGVLNSELNVKIKKENGEPTSSYKIKFPGDKLYRLKKIVNNTGALLVMSSSWRIGFNSLKMEPSPSFINANNQLNAYGMNIIDWTPVIKSRHRGTEIQWWLNNFKTNYGYIPSYIIIDDMIDDLLDLHRGHIVKTNSLLGLQDEHVNIAINLLNHK